MSEATPVNVTAFQPFEGGVGAEINATSTTARVQIPGTQAAATPDRLRVLVTNDGLVSASIRMGQANVEATSSCQRIMPGTQVLLTPPVVSPSPVWLAAICPSGGTVNLQITAGFGT